jgi:long-subunit acyl-CoA synthetase (AMP-forming)
VKIYEGYGQSECGNISINTKKDFRLGSVGKPSMDVKISDDTSEILVKFDKTRHDSNFLLNDQQEYIHTGDAGYLDKDGFLYLKGRLDDVIVLSNGKKIFPDDIECRIKRHECISQAIVVSLDQISLSAIVCCENSPTQKVFDCIRETNRSLQPHEQIRRIYIMKENFTVENGLMTGTLKPKRNAILDRYKSELFYVNV